MPTILGVFQRPSKVAETVRQLKGRGFSDLEVFSPSPFEEIEEAVDPKPSKVRYFTLIGGLLGVTTGYALTIWMSLDWPIVIGGKPYASIPPYTVIAFELTILFGAIGTLLGLLSVGRLPKFKIAPAYNARFFRRRVRSGGRVPRPRRRRGGGAAALQRSVGGEPCRLSPRLRTGGSPWPRNAWCWHVSSCSTAPRAGSSGA